MATLREIRQRISTVKSTQQITKAMKMVSAAKLRRAQESILAIRPYAYSLRDMIAHLAELDEEIVHLDLLAKRPVQKVLIVVVAADRGLCGGFNSNVMRAALNLIDKYSTTEYDLFAIGNKASEFFEKRGYSVYEKRLNFFHEFSFENAIEISRTLISLYEKKEYDRIEIVYNEFKSAIQQNIITEQFLPFVPQEGETDALKSVDYIYEPDIATILNTLIPKHLNIQIWRILLESNAAEQGARMTAMENATENAEEMKSTLTLHYNRARQAAITKELSEIVGGADALKES